MRRHLARNPVCELYRLGLACLDPVAEYDIGTRHLGGLGSVLHADDTGVGDLVMADQDAFELSGRDRIAVCGEC